MTKRRALNAFFAFCLAVGPGVVLVSACKKDEPPPPTTLPSDEDDKPKKKKKATTDDEDPKPVDPTGDDSSGAGTGTGVGVPGTGTGKKTSTNDQKKALLQACCTAIHNAAVAAGIAKQAGTVAIPGLPAPPPAPPKEELDKQAKACDNAVVTFTGDLNDSLKKVKGASPVALPSACNL